MHKPKIILVALAPIYSGKIVWVEQLFDFLNLFPHARMILSRMMLSSGNSIEMNMITPMLAEQYEKLEYLDTLLTITDEKEFLEATKGVIQKIVSYFSFSDNLVTLELMNYDMYWLLARQYGVLLPTKYQDAYKQFETTLLHNIQLIVAAEQKEDMVFILPIEQAYLVREQLCVEAERTVFIYGEDFLDEEEKI